MDDLQTDVYSSDEPDLYEPPDTAFEEFMQEVSAVKEWQEDHPELWDNVFRKECDAETYAFGILPGETRKKLVN